MQTLLDQLQRLRNEKNKKDLQKWVERASSQLLEMKKQVSNHYFLLLAEIYALDLRNLSKGQECLKKVSKKSELISFQWHLRHSYFCFLAGEYQQAIDQMQEIWSKAKGSFIYSKIIQDFLRRLIPCEEDEILSEINENKNTLQSLYFNALKYEREDSLEYAKELHKKIFDENGIEANIKYQSAKHLILFHGQKSKRYVEIVAKYEKALNDTQYYSKKVEFLRLVLEILREKGQEQVDYDLPRQYILENLSKLKDQADFQQMAKLKYLSDLLQNQPEKSGQICLKFLGEKKYKELRDKKLKEMSGRGNKLSNLKKQSSINSKPKIKEAQKIKQTISQHISQQYNQNFQGSVMTKINMNSGGYQQRYFYIRDDFRDSKKLYYCSRKGKQSEDDDYYRLKGFKKLTIGKISQALRRQECDEFQDSHCFTLKIDGEELYQRNFYVKSEQDLKNWLNLFRSIAIKNGKNESISRVKKTYLL